MERFSGHEHSNDVLEDSLMLVNSFSTLYFPEKSPLYSAAYAPLFKI